MSNMKWTDDQLNAINHSADSSACVTAAAGSGKTALLIERVVTLIRGSEAENIEPVPADKFAILTFTRNAAEEFRTRMTQAIDKASRGGDDRIPREQLIKFRSSFIGTINSFCLGVLRDNTQLFDLPVNFSIVEEGRGAAMMDRALDNTMEYFYSDDFVIDFAEKHRSFSNSGESGDGAFARELLLKTYSFENDTELRKAVRAVYYKATSLADRDEWLDGCAAVFSDKESAAQHFFPSIISGIPQVLNETAFRISKAEEYCAVINDDEMRDKLYAVLVPVKDYAEKLGESCRKHLLSGGTPTFDDFDEFHREIDAMPLPVVSTKSLPRAKKGDTENKNAAINCMTKAAAGFADIKTNTGYDSASFEEERKQQLSAMTALVMLAHRLDEEFTQIKRKASVVDFADCEQLLLREVKKPESELRKALSERYRCIIIDEFQDTNDLQYEIFRLISRNQNNLFFVGDIKQSIYAFRGGNPEIMAKCCENGSGYDKLPLNRNFRSRETVIKTVNSMFSGIMTRKYGDVDYSDNNQLVPGADFPESDCDYRSELHLLDYSSRRKADTPDNGAVNTIPGDVVEVPESEKVPTAAVSEARYAASLIAKMVREQFMVKDRDGAVRPCGWGDFAILLRSKTHLREYREALEELFIPVTSDSGNYLAADEIKLMISFLKVIDNPQLDEHILTVLMSPLYGFTANELSLAKLGLLSYDKKELENAGTDLTGLYDYYSKQSLFNCVMDAAGEDNSILYKSDRLKALRKEFQDRNISYSAYGKCVKFAQDFMDFRHYAANNSVERLIRHIYDNTDLFSVISTYERGDKKLANIRYLLKYTADFEKSGGGTLNDFLRYTDAMSQNMDKLKEAEVPQGAADTVKIMTFHASKGLQWPIVILGQLGSDFHDDKNNTMIIDRSTGIGLKNAFIEQRKLAYSLAFNAAKLSVKRQQKGEELRVLYVAMTRAEEKLIMIGCCSQKKCSELDERTKSAEDILGGANLAEWITASLLRYRDSGEGDSLPAAIEAPAVRLFSSSEKLMAPDMDIPEEQSAEAEPDEQTAEIISGEIAKKYAFGYDTTLQSRFSVTELAHRNDEQKAKKEAERSESSDTVGTSKSGETGNKLARPSFLSDDPAGIRINGILVGNTYHHIMELFPLETLRADYSYEDMEAAVENGISELIESASLTPEECYLAEKRKGTFSKKVADFFLSRLGQEMLAAQRVEREYSIFAELPAADLLPEENADAESRTILQGRVDMLYVTESKVVVVDYKSDSRSSLDSELDSYCQQVMLYRKILPLLMKECSTRRIELYLYSFEQEKAINVEDVEQI